MEWPKITGSRGISLELPSSKQGVCAIKSWRQTLSIGRDLTIRGRG